MTLAPGTLKVSLMSNTTARRIGPRMRAAARYVASHPGCAILPVARAVGPRGSIKFGYRAVHRAIAAGLITATRSRGRYALAAVPVVP